MNIAKTIAEVGPLLLQHLVSTGKDRGEDTSFLEEFGPRILEAVADQVLANEHTQKNQGKARFCPHLAGELLRGWPGEPSITAAKQAVQIAKCLVDEAERVCEPPARDFGEQRPGFGG